MGMEIALIPAAMFIMGIGMMIYMKKKRGSLAPGYAQQEMKRFVKEMVPQLSEEELMKVQERFVLLSETK